MRDAGRGVKTTADGFRAAPVGRRAASRASRLPLYGVDNAEPDALLIVWTVCFADTCSSPRPSADKAELPPPGYNGGMSKNALSAAGGVVLALLLGCTTQPADYQSIDDLPNPGRGWSTHSSFADEEANAHYPPSTVAYFRFTWSLAEPSEGGYAFDRIDALISRARGAGQRFAFRIMPDACQGDGSPCFSADAADPVYMAYAHALIAAMGARYNGNPDVEFVDIGLVGDYGEWHFTRAASLGAAMPPYSVRLQYVDWHLQAFPDTPVIMLVGDLTQTDSDTLSYAVTHGTGWRADCWGDYRSPTNHMEDDYPIKLSAPGVGDAWRTRPVVLETCGIPQDWYNAFPDRLQDALDFAVSRHASMLNAKSSAIPEEWVGALAEFTTHIGYRFAPAGTPVMPVSAAPGTPVTVTVAWTNLGNAPVYRSYAPAVRLVSGGVEIARSVSNVDVRTWMPRSADGVDYTVAFDLMVPAGTAKGSAAVQIALLDPGTNAPAIRLASGGGSADLWYGIGVMQIE
jgi:hypothetical protein